MRRLGSILALSLLPCLIASAQMRQQQQGGQGQDHVQQRLQQLQAELQQLNSEIQKVQNEANKSPEVRKALVNYSSTLTEEMKSIDPEKVELIERRQAVYEQLLDMTSDPETNPAERKRLQELGQKFNSIRQELQMTEAQANRRSNVKEALDAYNETIMREMAKIDPEISEKLERREAVSKEFSDMRKAIRSQ